jgi:hypothetical protein
VFIINIVTVIGPTPPGTGVMAEAFSLTGSKSTSPTRRKPLAQVASGTRLTPTSMTTQPSGTISALIARGTPMAATRMSAWSVNRVMSGVAVWQTVTVALAPFRFWMSMAASGLPTMLLRPQMTTCLPSGVAAANEELDDAVGRAGQRAGLAPEHLADVDGMEPVDVLVRGDEIDDLFAADVFRQGQLDEESVIAAVAVEVVDLAEDLLFGGVRRHPDRRLEDADLLGRLGLGRHIGHGGRVSPTATAVTARALLLRRAARSSWLLRIWQDTSLPLIMVAGIFSS